MNWKQITNEKSVCNSPAYYGTVRKPGWGKRGNRKWVTMAAGPGVTMQSGSPARELSLSIQQGGNQAHGERIKPEEVTGKNVTRALFY